MKAFYRVGTIVGYAAVNALMAVESVQSGNVLLWTKRFPSLQRSVRWRLYRRVVARSINSQTMI